MIEILMSTFNGGKYLRPQLDSILGQSFGEFCLIIRDDGSSDYTAEILQEYAARDERIRLFKDSRGNLGVRQSYMCLLESSIAEYFMLSDQDDVWLPEKISKSLAAVQKLEAEHGADLPILVFTDLMVADENVDIISPSLWQYQKLDPNISRNWRRLLAQNVVTGSTIMGNRAAAKAAIPFALPNMMHDHWIAVNSAKSGHIAFLAQPTVIYRQHAGNYEGGRRFAPRYALKKLPSIFTKVSNFKRSARHFGNVSASGIFARKVLLNLRRLFAR